MRLFVYLIVLTLFTSCTKTHVEYWDNGNMRLSYTTKKGEKHGLEQHWFKNGRLQIQFEYNNGVLSGTGTRWYFNGHKEREDTYTEGKLNGISKLWNENGSLSIEKEYVNDTLHGIFREWFENGQLKVEGAHYKNLFHGTWTYYDPRGIKVGEGHFEKGKGILKGYNLNGLLNREVAYKNNMKNGKEIWYNEAGFIEKIIVFENDRIISVKDELQIENKTQYGIE